MVCLWALGWGLLMCVCVCVCVCPHLMLKTIPKVTSRLLNGGHLLIAWSGLGDVHT